MKRTNYYYPEALLERVRTAAFKLRISMSEFIRRAVEDALKRGGK